jgi:hypothetical protein
LIDFNPTVIFLFSNRIKVAMKRYSRQYNDVRHRYKTNSNDQNSKPFCVIRHTAAMRVMNTRYALRISPTDTRRAAVEQKNAKIIRVLDFEFV